ARAYEPPGRANRRYSKSINIPRYFTQSRQFHLGGHDDELVLPLRQRRQLDLPDAPAGVFEGAAERRLTGDVARQLDRRGVETRGHLDRAPLRLRADRLEHQGFLEQLLPDLLHGPDGRHTLR